MTRQEANWSIRQARMRTQRVAQLVAEQVVDSETERDGNDIIRYVRERGEVTKTEIANNFRRIPRRFRNELLNDLVEAARLEAKTIESTGSKPATVFRLGARG